MTRLNWSQTSQRLYESGIDRGVLYPEVGPGVVWNGLTSVEEGFVGGDVESLYYDGRKYLDLVANRNFQATLSAFSIPNEFGPCIGEQAVSSGFYLTRQPRKRFGLAYRTSEGPDEYQIHLIYNAMASPSNRKYSSINNSPSPIDFEWTIDAVPNHIAGSKPTAHIVLDSRLIDSIKLEKIEDLLYGVSTESDTLDGGGVLPDPPEGNIIDGGTPTSTSENIIDGNIFVSIPASDPMLPPITTIMDILAGLYDVKYIIPQTVSGLAELELGYGDLVGTSIAGIYQAHTYTRLTETVTDGLYSLE